MTRLSQKELFILLRDGIYAQASSAAQSTAVNITHRPFTIFPRPSLKPGSTNIMLEVGAVAMLRAVPGEQWE